MTLRPLRERAERLRSIRLCQGRYPGSSFCERSLDTAPEVAVRNQLLMARIASTCSTTALSPLCLLSNLSTRSIEAATSLRTGNSPLSAPELASGTIRAQSRKADEVARNGRSLVAPTRANLIGSQQEPSRKTRNLLERDGCRSFRKAWAS